MAYNWCTKCQFLSFPHFPLEPGLYSTPLVLTSSTHRQQVTCWHCLSVPSLRPALKEFIFMLFSLLIVPCTFTPGDCIFQLVVLNCYKDVLEYVAHASLGGARAVFHTPLTYNLWEEKCAPLLPETQSSWKARRLQHCLRSQGAQFRSWCAKLPDKNAFGNSKPLEF